MIPQSTTPCYSDELAAHLSQASLLAYQSNDTIIAHCQAEGLLIGRNVDVVIIDDPQTDIRLFVAVAGDVCLIVPEGTNCLHDWLTNLNVEQIDIGGGVKVHKGFWRGVQAIYDCLINFLAAHPEIKIFYIPGHSKGAAHGALIAYKLATQWRHPLAEICCLVFDQPRVGNAAWACEMDFFVPNYSRVVFKEEIVSHVPFLCGKYRHAGRTIFIDDLGIEHDGIGFWQETAMCAAGLWWEVYRQHREVLIKDHACGLVADYFSEFLPKLA